MVLSTNITKNPEGLAEVPLKGYLSQWGEYAKLFAEEDEVTNNVTVFIEENASLWSC